MADWDVQSSLRVPNVTHHQRRAVPITPARRLVHAMLDGVFECRNHFFDVRRQLATTLNLRRQRDRRSQNQSAVQRNGSEIVVEIGPPTERRASHDCRTPGRQSLPVARPSDVRAPFVGEKHVSPRLKWPGLATAVHTWPALADRHRRQRPQVRRGPWDSAWSSRSSRAAKCGGHRQSRAPATKRRNASSNCCRWPSGTVHRRFNPVAELRRAGPRPRSTEPEQACV